MTKALVFDMDGTIADLYKVNGWLEDIHNENVRPYVLANPIYNAEELNILIDILKQFGWKIIITTWLAKDATEEYNEKVRKAKIEWLAKNHFDYDEIHLVKYGTTKANCTRKHGGFQILIDDNEKIRNGWTLGDTINANENILKALADLVLAELG